MAQASPGAPPAATGDIALSCRPDRAGNKLVFPYTVVNNGTSDVYVMDAVAKMDPATRAPTVDPHAAVIWLGGDGFAHILKGIAPLPHESFVIGRVVPLAARLPPNSRLERTLEVPLPLAETGPYNPDLPLREYEPVDIQGVTLIVEFLRATVEGFAAAPVDYAPGLFRVSGKNTAGQVERVFCSFPSRQLQILKRSDDFARPD